jgi:hypothetical protein
MLIDVEFVDELRYREAEGREDLDIGRIGGFSAASAGGSEGITGEGLGNVVVVFLATVELVRAAADIRRMASKAKDGYRQVRVNESGIDLLARRELEVRNERTPSLIEIVPVNADETYIASYRLHDGRVGVLRFRFDSTFVSFDVLSDETTR